MEKIEEYRVKVDEIEVTVAIMGGTGQTHLYHVNIPQIAPATKALLENIKHGLIREVVVSTTEILDPKAVHVMKKKFSDRAEQLLKTKIPTISPQTVQLLINVLMQEMLGLGDIEYLTADENLEEVVITSSKEPVRVYHKRYGWLETNIQLASEEQILNYSNIIGRRVGRQITTLNPLLDAHLLTGDRANAVLFPISTKGHTITIRKFARDPWTMTDLIANNTCNARVLALIWLAMQYEMNILISGGTASGKTSFLNVLMPFIPPNHRIVSIEDSVHPSSAILYRENNIITRSTIGQLVDAKLSQGMIKLNDGTEIHPDPHIEIFSVTKEGKVQLTKPSSLLRHKVNKDLYTITLASGKQIKVTGDHSLFSLVNNTLTAIPCHTIKEGDLLATPRHLIAPGQHILFDLENYLPSFSNFQLEGPGLHALLKAHKNMLLQHKSKAQVTSYIKKNRLPISLFLKLHMKLYPESKEDISIMPLRSSRHGRIKIPLLMEIDNDLACLVGFWLADGSYDKNSIIFSVANEQCNNIVQRVAAQLGTQAHFHSDGVSLMIHSAAFKRFFEKVLHLQGNAYTKDIPSWVYGLEREKIEWLLRGYMSGDGWPRENDICVGSCSPSLLEGVQTLFIRLGILFRRSHYQYKDNTYEGFISGSPFLKKFLEMGGFIQDDKNEKLQHTIKKSTKAVTDIIPLSKTTYLPLKHALGEQFKKSLQYTSWKSWHGQYTKSHIGYSYLQRLITTFLPLETMAVIPPEVQEAVSLASHDLFWDKVISITKEPYHGYVYDISVPEQENFVCNNILCHNTRELLLPRFLYWCPLTIRQPNPEGKGEVTMLNLLVNALRMRPDRIILGEMRKKDQAEVLFEAMHTGHSVYATVHADSLAETIQRLINPPIEVPTNLLVGVNLNVVMFRDRRKGIRRVYQVGEFIPSTEEGVGGVRPNILYRWRPVEDDIVEHSSSLRLYDELSRHTGMTLMQIESDLKKKQNILQWMAKNSIRHVDKVGEIMKQYYIDADSVLELSGERSTD